MSRKSILLIESDVNLRQSIALILQRAGYMVTGTDCVSIALEIIGNEAYQLLVSDVNMPETNMVLMPKLSELYPSLPVVILTDQSSADAELENKLYQARYLVKPVDPEYLLGAIGSIIGPSNNGRHLNG